MSKKDRKSMTATSQPKQQVAQQQVVQQPASQQTATKPQQTATKPQQTATKPQQTATKPQQTATKPQQTAANVQYERDLQEFICACSNQFVEYKRDLQELTRACGNRFTEHENAIKKYGVELSGLQQEIRKLKAAVFTSDATTASAASAPAPVAPATPVATPVAPAPVASATPAPAAKVAGGYTGYLRVCFIHGADGKYDRTHPITSCLVAKFCDPNYRFAYALYENGQFVRELTPAEVAAYEWD